MHRKRVALGENWGVEVWRGVEVLCVGSLSCWRYERREGSICFAIEGMAVGSSRTLCNVSEYAAWTPSPAQTRASERKGSMARSRHELA